MGTIYQPKQGLCVGVVNEIKPVELEFWFVYRLQYTLSTRLKYNNITPDVIELPEYVYQTVGVTCDNHELLVFDVLSSKLRVK